MPVKRVPIMITRDDPFGPDGTLLIQELDLELNGLYPSSSVHGLHPEDADPKRLFFYIARQNGDVLGCGGFRILETDLVEIKRMYVRQDFRRLGIANMILEFLEETVRDMKFPVIRLETGFRQIAANTLYEKNGYYSIECYGEYADDPHSRCYEKVLEMDV